MVRVQVDIELLRQVPIFTSLTDKQLTDILVAPENGIVEFKSSAPIIEEDEIGDCMYIILDGFVDIRIKAASGLEISIATMNAGEFFGEQALLPGTSGLRNASVRAIHDCQLFKIIKKDVALGLIDNQVYGNLDDNPEGVSEADRVRMLIRSVRLFRSLSLKNMQQVETWTEVVTYDPEEMIIRESEQGDYMYIVLDGTVDVFVEARNGEIVILTTLKKGNYFGEQALLPASCGKRNANVRASSRVTLVRVAKKYFQLIVNHDEKLMLALQAVGSAQAAKIVDAIGRSFGNS